MPTNFRAITLTAAFKLLIAAYGAPESTATPVPPSATPIAAAPTGTPLSPTDTSPPPTNAPSPPLPHLGAAHRHDNPIGHSDARTAGADTHMDPISSSTYDGVRVAHVYNAGYLITVGGKLGLHQLPMVP